MGELKIKGSAQRSVQNDRMVIRIEFLGKENTPSEISKKVLGECETYLGKLKEAGFDISQIALREDKVQENRWYGEEHNIDYSASREIEIKTDYDMHVVNLLRKISDDLGLNCLFRFNYELSNEEEIRKQLQQEALRNAKAQAEMLAEAVGQKLAGLKSADKDAPRVECEGGGEVLCMLASCDEETAYEQSDELAAKEVILTEDIYTVWEIQ